MNITKKQLPECGKTRYLTNRLLAQRCLDNKTINFQGGRSAQSLQ